MKVIVDTTAWYGYFVKSDKFHDESVAFIDTKPEIIISNIIFEEVLALKPEKPCLGCVLIRRPMFQPKKMKTS